MPSQKVPAEKFNTGHRTAPTQAGSAIAACSTGARVRKQGLVVVNPHARRGQDPIDGILAYMAARGLDPHLERISDPTLIPAVIAAKRDLHCVIVGGGDGTVSAAVRGVLKSGLTLGLLPMGTANDLALTLGIPADLQAAADVILAGQTRLIDIGTVNDHPFFNVASIGISSEMADGLCHEGKRRWGRLSYVIAALRALLQSRPFPALITVEDTSTRVRTLHIAVGNGRHYGGGNTVAADAAIDDGNLDLFSLEIDRIWKLILMAPYIRSGRHGRLDGVRTARSTAFDVTTRARRAVTADGERVTHTPARFRILTGAVRVFAPQPAGSGEPVARPPSGIV